MLKTLSQGHFSLLETCPRKFQYIYKDQLSVPVDPEIQARQRWGSQFHMLMQQREMGLPVDVLPAEGEEFQACIEALVETASDVFSGQGVLFRQSEHPRSLAFNGYLLTAIYDLLLLDHKAGKIVDWKTYLQPPTAASLFQDWQTRLYLFLLVETTWLAPEQVSMSYWFVRCRDSETGQFAPQQLSVDYSSARHRQTSADLQRLTDSLTAMLEQDQPLPQVDLSKGICQHCPFAYRCDRIPSAAPAPLPALTTIAEIPIE